MKDKLLASGVAAGPLFLTVSLTQALTREGFDLSRHPLSLLSLGDVGWIQIANFVATGALNMACAAGMRRALHEQSGGKWGPALVAGYGAGLVMAGAFVTDPGAGFPPGAPLGAPERLSWHGLLHEISFLLSLLSWTGACSIFARTFIAAGQRRWAAACICTVAAVAGIALWPDLPSISVRLVVATAVQMGFVAALAVRIGRRLDSSVKPGHELGPVLAGRQVL